MSEDMSIDEPFHIEQEGAISGLNPMFGEWQKTFKFAPVPYRDGSERRKQFRQEMQEQMTHKKGVRVLFPTPTSLEPLRSP